LETGRRLALLALIEKRTNLTEVDGPIFLSVITSPQRIMASLQAHTREGFSVSLSTDLATKSVRAAVASIEVSNKPNFLSRRGVRVTDVECPGIVAQGEVAFDHNEALDSMYELIDLISPILKEPRHISIQL
jgi:hypothetical protein